MRHRHPPLPRLWLMTDERVADVLGAVERLPKGSGIVFRHHATEARMRHALFDQVKAIARRQRLILLLADTPVRARSWGADGAHHRSRLRSLGIRTIAVHNRRELRTAIEVGANLVFVSPVFATRSHPSAQTLGPVRLGLLASGTRGNVIALGGMNVRCWTKLRGLGLHGWAAIDALS